MKKEVKNTIDKEIKEIKEIKEAIAKEAKEKTAIIAEFLKNATPEEREEYYSNLC